VAVDPPAWVCHELTAWARGMAADARAAGSPRESVRVLDAHSLHLTLCFLGSRPVGEIEALADVLGACEERACELSLGAPLMLPPRRPRALAVEVRDSTGELSAVHERVSRRLTSVSAWEPERRRFRPHITLARVRTQSRRKARPVPDRAIVAGGDPEPPLPATPRLNFTPQSIVLYRSWLAPEGASYEALASASLQGGPDIH
jgi:2'-5' RNA ligase